MSLKREGWIKQDTKELNNRCLSKVNKFNRGFRYSFRDKVVVEINLERNIIIVGKITMGKNHEFCFSRV